MPSELPDFKSVWLLHKYNVSYSSIADTDEPVPLFLLWLMQMLCTA